MANTEQSLVLTTIGSTSSIPNTEQSLVSTTIGSTSSIPNIQIPNVTQFLTIKLTSTNYLLWHAQIMPLLHGYRFASHVDGTVIAPDRFLSTGEPNPAFMD